MIITVTTQKGGVGKTTTALNLGAALAKYGKVLLVDMEPQADLTRYAGAGRFTPPIDMTDVLARRTSIQNVILKGARYDLAINTKKMKREALTYTGHLAEELEQLHSAYDYIIIDTPPAVNVQSVEAMSAAQYIIIPTQLQPGAVAAVEEDLEALRDIKKSNRGLESFYILPTMYAGRTNGQQRFYNGLQASYNSHVLPPVRACQQIPDSQEQGADIFATYPNSNAAADYAEVAEMLNNLLTKENKAHEK